MNRWKTTFAFITGFLLMHLLSHIWVEAEGMLPFTSRLVHFTLTHDTNTVVMIINSVLVVVCGYFAFLHDWETRLHAPRHA